MNVSLDATISPFAKVICDPTAVWVDIYPKRGPSLSASGAAPVLMAAAATRGGKNNLRALVTILCTYGVITISQVNIASIYLPVSITFNEQIVGLGVLTSAFFIGYGIVEIAGGVAGARFGAKTVANLGLLITILSLVACAFAPSFGALIALRFAVGIGFGLFFPSGLVLAIRQMAEASSGLAAGSTTAAFSIGGAAGVFGWSVLSAVYGWRASLLIQAAILFATAMAFVLWVPSDRSSSAPNLSSSAFRTALTNRKLLAVSVLLFGSGATSILSGNFLVYYLEKSFDVQPGYAGFIAALSYAVVLVTALVGGRVFDRGSDPKLIVLISILVLASGTAIIAVHSVLLALVGSLLCGLAIGPISVVAIVTARRSAASQELEPLVIGVADQFSLAGVFAGALVFPFLVVGLGYPPAWLIGASITLVLAVPYMLLKEI